jgi:hypothetical protein
VEQSRVHNLILTLMPKDGMAETLEAMAVSLQLKSNLLERLDMLSKINSHLTQDSIGLASRSAMSFLATEL